MTIKNRKLRVFLCHSSQDKIAVRDLYRRLLEVGWLDPWLDEKKILPGKNWEMEIEKAVESADVVIVCLSHNSVSKEGYVQRELNLVLDLALEKPDDAIFVIPLRLDDCAPPRRLQKWHYVDYFPVSDRENAFTHLLDSLRSRSDSITKSSSRSSNLERDTKKYYVAETLDFREIYFDYFPESFNSQKMFAYKVSPLPENSRETQRKTLTFTLINKTEKPIKVIEAYFENRKRERLPLDAFTSELPKVLEPFIGESQISLVIDQLWSFAMSTDERFSHQFSSLFFFDNLVFDFESIVFRLNDGTLIRHKVSKKMLAEVKAIFNPAPKISGSPTLETQCCADDCHENADYIVLLYDHYSDGSVFFEQDFTCPFLCEKHMQENERGVGNAGVGKRRYPRGSQGYPYSNRHDALGYSKYLPIDREALLKRDRA